MDFWKPAESGKESIKSKLLNMSRQQWVVLLLLGLLLAVAALPVSNKTEKKSSQGILNDSSLDSFGTGDAADKSELEKKLESLLSNVEGVGSVQVILMTGPEKDAQGFGNSGGQKITGVLIAAEGADNSVTVQNIQQAVMALFQVEAHKIKVMKMK